ncbi:MAG: hypothetical protein V4685_12915 [Bacteroidota bacterium]
MKIVFTFIVCLFVVASMQAQPSKKGFFSLSSSQMKDAKEYGKVIVTAGSNTIVIGTVIAYGENVKGLTVRINNGFAFKLAPAQSGTILNYVGSSLNIVLQPFEKATIEFIDVDKKTGTKQLHVSGEVVE